MIKYLSRLSLSWSEIVVLCRKGGSSPSAFFFFTLKVASTVQCDWESSTLLKILNGRPICCIFRCRACTGGEVTRPFVKLTSLRSQAGIKLTEHIIPVYAEHVERSSWTFCSAESEPKIPLHMMIGILAGVFGKGTIEQTPTSWVSPKPLSSHDAWSELELSQAIFNLDDERKYEARAVWTAWFQRHGGRKCYNLTFHLIWLMNHRVHATHRSKWISFFFQIKQRSETGPFT